jgi:photoactive yellow protein
VTSIITELNFAVVAPNLAVSTTGKVLCQENDVKTELIDQRFQSSSEADLLAVPLGIVRLDKQGNILYYEGAAAALARQQPTMLGMRFFRDIPPTQRIKDLQGQFEHFVAKPGSGIEQHSFLLRYAFGDRGLSFTLVRRGGPQRSFYVVVNATHHPAELSNR